MMQIDESGHWFPRWDNHQDCPRCRSCDPEDDPCVICDLWDAGTLLRYRRTLFYKEKLNRGANRSINPILMNPSNKQTHKNRRSSALASAASEVPSPTAPTIESILPDVPTSSVDCTSRHQDRPINGLDPPPSYDRVIQDDIQREQELTNRVDALESERQLNNMGRENRALSMLAQHIRGAARNEQASIENQRIDGRSRQRRRFSNEDFNDIGPPGQSDQRDSGFSDATNSRVHHPPVSSSGSCDDQAMTASAYNEIAQRIRHDPELPTFDEVEGNRSLHQIPLYPTAPPQHEIPLETSGQSPNESFSERFPSQPSAPPLCSSW